MSWGNPQTFAERLWQKTLLPAAWAYRLAQGARNSAYKAGILRKAYCPCPVVSIGNITCGGTGKTPITIDLAGRALAQGKKVAILSRGYRRKSKDKTLVVSDGDGPLVSAKEAGDEPYMMAQALPQAVIIVGSSRKRSARLAVEKYGCDLIFLDDGFQHIALERDQDLVLIDYNDNLQKDALLPAGRLREPISTLSRASQIIVTKVPVDYDPDKLDGFRKLASRYAPHALFSSCRFSPSHLSGLSRHAKLAASALSGKRIMAFCGIARPEPFFASLEKLGAEILSKRAFADHHWYKRKDIDSIKSDFLASGAELIVTTMKDLVRLEGASDLPLFAPEQEVIWLDPVPAITNLNSARVSS